MSKKKKAPKSISAFVHSQPSLRSSSFSLLPLCSLPLFFVFLIQTSKPGHLHRFSRSLAVGNREKNPKLRLEISFYPCPLCALPLQVGPLDFDSLSVSIHSSDRFFFFSIFFFRSEGKTQRKAGFFGYLFRSWVCRGWGREWPGLGARWVGVFFIFYFCYVGFLWLVNENVWY